MLSRRSLAGRRKPNDRKKHGAKETDYLFVGYTGRAGSTPARVPISPAGLYQLFRHYAQLAGVPAHVTPHSARATAITKLLADGIAHRKVQEFSRHSSIQMVEVYDKRRVSVDENPAGQLEFSNRTKRT
jgi:integrase